MTPSHQVSAEDLARVAELANLELTPEEQAPMLRDLNAILGYVAQLNELDTANVPPMAQVAEMLPQSGPARPLLRADEPRPTLDRAVVMASAPDSDGIFFRVPKVIER